MIRDGSGYVLATCSADGGDLRVNDECWRFATQTTEPPADLHGMALGLCLLAGVYRKETRPVATCHWCGAPLVEMKP